MKKILVIRFRRIGDSVISSTLCSSLKLSFPDSEIHYVLNANTAPLYQYHPAIDRVISFTNEELNSLPKYLANVRRIVKENKYDIIIDTRSTVKTSFFSLFSLHTSYRIGRKKGYNRFIQNYRIDNSYKGGKNNVELTLSLLDPLKKKYNIRKDPVFKVYYQPSELEAYKEYMISQGIDFSKPVIICAVTARLEYKIWAKDKMREILKRIIEKYDAQLIFNFGDAKEKEAAERLQKEMNNDKHIFTNVEAKNLRELVVMLANSSFFFGNEGGTRHISQAVDLPSFAIYPPNIPLENWLPNRSKRFQGIELADIDAGMANDKSLTYEQKLDLIDVESVWKKLDKMLADYFPVAAHWVE